MAEIVKKGGRTHGRKFVCGVPDSDCTGSLSQTPSKGRKLHSTSAEAFKCMERHLLKEGYIKRGPREFEAPNGGPIRVLTKKSRFGLAYRPGKEGRWMSRQFPAGGVGSC